MGLTGMTVTGRTDNGLLRKTVNNQTQKGSKDAPDKKKVKINHTYLFEKNVVNIISNNESSSIFLTAFEFNQIVKAIYHELGFEMVQTIEPSE